MLKKKMKPEDYRRKLPPDTERLLKEIDRAWLKQYLRERGEQA